jgi:glycosyltransferase involved in cell wall biosynthesis
MTYAARVLGRPSRRRVALIHYWLVTMRGGERVLERLINLFPDADIFTHVYNPDAVSEVIRSRPVKTTFIDRLPASRRLYQKYLPLMPYALERLDLTGYDLVISCESGPAKGVIPPPDALHVCYTHSPMRYLWDQHALYRANAGRASRLGTDLFFKSLRAWDVTTAQRVDRFAANSQFVARRIEKYFRRDSTVIYPPIDLSLFQPQPASAHEDYFLWCSQFTAYKRPDLAIDAFNRLGLPLVMVGQGPILEQMKKRAGPNIKILERLPFDQLKAAYRSCKALVFTAEEDFGMVPVEVMASGRPVIALGRGGVLETVTEEVSGLFFDCPEVDDLIDAVERFERWRPHFDQPKTIALTKRFAPELFDRGILALTTQAAAVSAAA